jgi:eukaryotic-like serine/threonine-protein kinase
MSDHKPPSPRQHTLADTSLPNERGSPLREGDLVDGKYRLVRELGEGGMASVFMAVDTRLKRDVALKIVRPRIALQPAMRAMFMREAESMAKLRHPNVIEVYDVGSAGSCPYLVMPYQHGADLEAWCKHRDGPPMPLDVAVGILGQACAGVAAMHAVGLVHRDIKPQNILVLGTFEVVVADLGLTHHYTGDEHSHGVFGTPGFLAPELIWNEPAAEGLAAAGDVYAMGVTAYWLLTGRLPASTDLAEILSHATPPPIVPPSEVLDVLPVAFDEPLLRALDPDPKTRIGMVELREALFEARDAVRAQRGRPSPFVVVVDDDPLALQFIAEVVREALHTPEVVALADAPAALSVIESRPPDLVITDLQMPQVNGLELTAMLRGNANTRDVPIIVLTGVGGAPEWSVLHGLGAARFLVKPIDPDTLHDVIRRVMHVSSDQG